MSRVESKSGGQGNVEERTVVKTFKAVTRKEGAGFTIHRPIGDSEMSTATTDPFLMLDELGPVTYGKGEFEGAPWHPHRGIDTVMYLKEGQGDHQDSTGNKGSLYAGDVIKSPIISKDKIINNNNAVIPWRRRHAFFAAFTGSRL